MNIIFNHKTGIPLAVTSDKLFSLTTISDKNTEEPRDTFSVGDKEFVSWGQANRYPDEAVNHREHNGHCLLLCRLRIAGKGQTDHRERHAQRQKPKAHHRHGIDRVGRVPVKHPCQRHGRENKDQGNCAHQWEASAENNVKDVENGGPVLFADADGQQNPLNRHHAVGQCPDDTQEGIGSGKGGDPDIAHILQDQDIDHNTAEHLHKAGQRTRIAAPDDLQRVLPPAGPVIDTSPVG